MSNVAWLAWLILGRGLQQDRPGADRVHYVNQGVWSSLESRIVELIAPGSRPRHQNPTV